MVLGEYQGSRVWAQAYCTCSFTRFMTRQLLRVSRSTFGDQQLSVISYGPCQTPTLAFCVRRAREIRAFIPRQFWELGAELVVAGEPVTAQWVRNRCFNEGAAIKAHRAASRGGGKVASYLSKECSAKPPVGLNTVALLRAAAGSIGLSPHKTMEVAEGLYMAGPCVLP